MAKSDEELLQPNTHPSPASTLPPDILSLIFQHACPIPDLNERHGLPDVPRLSEVPSRREKGTQFILSTVSVYWRQVSTLLTPYLWTSVDLIVSPSTVNEASAILQAFFTYSGQLPLAIAIEFAKPWKYDTGVLVDTSSDLVLYENTHRIHELYLCGLPNTWNDLLPSLSNLAHLSIEHKFVRGRPPVTIKSQCSHLTLKPFPGRALLSCSEIVALHLYKARIDFCLQMLMTCPNLIEFRARDPQEARQEREETLPTDSFVLPNMEVFEWSVNTEFLPDVAMLRHIRMPALRKLVWVEEENSPTFDTTDPRNIFLHNLPSTLIELHVHELRAESDPFEPLASIFDYIPDSLNIECLLLSRVDGAFLAHVFERLTPGLKINGSQQWVKLPKLKAIRIKGHSAPTELDQDKILQMLERRFVDAGTLNQEPFRLEFQAEVAWLSWFKEKLKEMIGHGLKVEIFEDAKLVDWLSTPEQA